LANRSPEGGKKVVNEPGIWERKKPTEKGGLTKKGGELWKRRKRRFFCGKKRAVQLLTRTREINAQKREGVVGRGGDQREGNTKGALGGKNYPGKGV